MYIPDTNALRGNHLTLHPALTPSDPSLISIGSRVRAVTWYSNDSTDCASHNLNGFTLSNPPLGEKCAIRTDDFVQYFGGYLDNPNKTSNYRYRLVEVDECYTPLTMRFEDKWRGV